MLACWQFAKYVNIRFDLSQVVLTELTVLTEFTDVQQYLK